MLESTPPEIASADLAPLALQLASWGCPDGQGLAWLDPPEPQALQDARELLLDLAAADEKGALTDTGGLWDVCVLLPLVQLTACLVSWEGDMGLAAAMCFDGSCHGKEMDGN